MARRADRDHPRPGQGVRPPLPDRLGRNHAGWSVERARVELDRILQQVERGTWEPPSRNGDASAAIDAGETVHVTASRWWQGRKAALAPNTRLDYGWRLDHVLRHLAHDTTAELDAHRVDPFRGELETAGLSRGKRRRAKVPKPARTFLEPDMVVDLLDVADEWERSLLPHQRYGRRAFLATLCLAGPRISELTETTVGRLDLESAGLQLGLKTAAGIDRHLELSAFVANELRTHLESLAAALHDRKGATFPALPTRNDGRLNPSNIRNRLLTGTAARNGKAPIRASSSERTRNARPKAGCSSRAP